MLGVSSQPSWASLGLTETWGEGGRRELGLERGGDATSSLGNFEALASYGM